MRNSATWATALFVVTLAAYLYIDKCTGPKPCPPTRPADSTLVRTIQAEAGLFHHRFDSAVEAGKVLTVQLWLQQEKLDSMKKIVKISQERADYYAKMLKYHKDTVLIVQTCDSLAIEYHAYKEQVNAYVRQSDSAMAAAWDDKEALEGLVNYQQQYIQRTDSTLRNVTLTLIRCQSKCAFFRRLFKRCNK